jgi:hypothetical protein
VLNRVGKINTPNICKHQAARPWEQQCLFCRRLSVYFQNYFRKKTFSANKIQLDEKNRLSGEK